jgi:hypothetical protein
VYVNHGLKGKLLESEILVQQASRNTKEQFSNSPDFANELMKAIMDALTAHSTMSKHGAGFGESSRAEGYLAGAGAALRRTVAKGRIGPFLNRKRFDAKFSIAQPHT